MDMLLSVWLLVIVASSVLVGFTGGRIVELKRTERILREIADEAANPQEGETNNAEG